MDFSFVLFEEAETRLLHTNGRVTRSHGLFTISLLFSSHSISLNALE
jgi:hypothetical protein